MTKPRSTRASDASTYQGPYRGQTVAVGTKHGKEQQFQPAFAAVLGAVLLTPPDLDTDRFGTFSGDVPRAGTALDAVRAKAKLATDVTGLPYGLASEASYGQLPGGWFGHEELLLFCDERLGIEVLEGHRTLSVPGAAQLVHDSRDVRPALLVGLPDQALIVRPCRHDRPIIKGITDVETLQVAVTAAAAHSPDGLAQVEPDLRAHHNPSRRRILARLADTLAHRLAAACPACATPGFGRVDAESGLPCRRCAAPTPLLAHEVHACARCDHRVTRPVSGVADPAHCPRCNP